MNKLKKNCGFSYDIEANIGKIYYDEKKQDNIYMNAGIYDSLQIVIGSGKGQNWWSLVFPYAFEGIVTQNDVESKKTDDIISTYDIISSDDIKIEFGILKLISQLFN